MKNETYDEEPSSSIDRDDGEPTLAFGEVVPRPPHAPLSRLSAATALEFQRSNEAHWKALEKAVQLPDRKLAGPRGSRRGRIESSTGDPAWDSHGSRAYCCVSFPPGCAPTGATSRSQPCC